MPKERASGAKRTKNEIAYLEERRMGKFQKKTVFRKTNFNILKKIQDIVSSLKEETC